MRTLSGSSQVDPSSAPSSKSQAAHVHDFDRSAERPHRRGRDDAAHACGRYRGGCRLPLRRSRQCRRGDVHSGVPLGHIPAVHRYSDARQHGRPEAGPHGAQPLARHQDHPGFRPGEAIRGGTAGRQPLLRQAAGDAANDHRIADHGGCWCAEDRSRPDRSAGGGDRSHGGTSSQGRADRAAALGARGGVVGGERQPSGVARTGRDRRQGAAGAGRHRRQGARGRRQAAEADPRRAASSHQEYAGHRQRHRVAELSGSAHASSTGSRPWRAGWPRSDARTIS